MKRMVTRVRLESFHVCALVVAVFLMASCVSRVPSGPRVLGMDLNPPAGPGGQPLPAGMPFHQAVPLPAGALVLPDGETVALRSASMAGYGRRMAMWPDGSVRWLLVEGALRADLPAETGPLQASVAPPLRRKPRAAPAGPVVSVEAHGSEVVLRGADGERLHTLTPSAAMVPVRLPVAVGGDDPDYLDGEGQYLWAAAWTALHPDPQPVALEMTLRDAAREDRPGRRVYRFRGVGAHPRVEGRLEWQLRVVLHEESPVVQLEMTWSAFWDEQAWALAGAAWSVTTHRAAWQEVRSAATPFDIADGQAWAMGSRHDGTTFHGPADAPLDAPADDWLVLEDGGGFLGLALPRFTRLGPNRVQVDGTRIEIRCWDPDSGRALDLRRTGTDDEFNIADADLRSRPLGLSRTLEVALIPGTDRDRVAAQAAALAARADQWFPRATGILATGALGPIRPAVLREGAGYLEGLRANLHFLRASQERWRWFGYVNYGDVRTNFSVGRNEARALFPLRWALSGRYGWRNVSGDVPYRMLRAGLLLDDREIALMALDYARHVSDVDLAHPSFVDPPRPDAGGFHRRNRDHWSGSVQMQYSPCNGVYLASWLTGSARMSDALAALRAYALRDGGSSSALAAQAWINRYRETHRAEDLATARALLERAGAWWSERSGGVHEGLDALYAGNFRWLSDGVNTLIPFYEGTGDPEYLALIHRILMREIEGEARPSLLLAAEGVMGYLVGAGLDPEAIGKARLDTADEYIRSLFPSDLPARDEWTYERLVEIVTRDLPGAPSPVHRESNAIGGRAFNALFALNLLVPLEFNEDRAARNAGAVPARPAPQQEEP